jgi:hypothetical protein
MSKARELSAMLNSMEVIDLTHLLEENMPTYPTHLNNRRGIISDSSDKERPDPFAARTDRDVLRFFTTYTARKP